MARKAGLSAFIDKITGKNRKIAAAARSAKRFSSSRTARSEEPLEETPRHLMQKEPGKEPVAKAARQKQKSKVMLLLGRFIVSPLYKLFLRLKKNKKLRLRFCVTAALFAAGIFAVAMLLSSGGKAAAGLAYVSGTASAGASEAPSISYEEMLQRIAAETKTAVSTPGSHVQQTTAASMTPVPTTPPEPSITPDPTTKPKATPKKTPKTTPKKSAKPAPKKSAKPAPKPTPKPTKAPSLSELSEYFMVEADTYYDDVGYSSNHYDYTEDEVLMLARVITREAGNESYEGMLAVGNVVMNRVFCGHWGKTIESVVTAKSQFAYKPDSTPKPRCVEAAKDVLKNQHWVVPQNVYFFNSGRKAGEDWGRYKYCTKIGGHCFYTHKIGRRYMGDGIPPALYKRTFKWPQYGCKPENRVKRLQQMLKKLDYETNTDGYFGKTTKEAVIKFQKDKKLKADGVAGPSTMKALIKAYGKDAYIKKYVK